MFLDADVSSMVTEEVSVALPHGRTTITGRILTVIPVEYVDEISGNNLTRYENIQVVLTFKDAIEGQILNTALDSYLKSKLEEAAKQFHVIPISYWTDFVIPVE